MRTDLTRQRLGELQGAPWIADGVTNDELGAVVNLRALASDWPEAAALMTTIPGRSGGLMRDVETSLEALRNYGRFEWLLSQPWVQDGLTAEEGAAGSRAANRRCFPGVL